MAKKDEVTFEIQVLTGGRWEAQGVYNAREEQRALADAKSLEQVSTIRQVKVVKEFHDPEANATRVFTVYESRLKPSPQERAKQGGRAGPAAKKVHHTPRKQQPVSRAKAKAEKPGHKAGQKTGGSPSEDMVAAPKPEAGSGKPRVSLLSAFVQTILSLVAALVTAMAVTQLANMSMHGVASIGFLNRDDFLILVFILVFVVTALALITRVLTKLRGVAPILSPSPEPRPATRPIPQARKPRRPVMAAIEQPTAEPEPVAEEPEEKPQEEIPEEEAKEPEAEQAAEPEEEPAADVLSELIAMNAFTAEVMDGIKSKGEKPDAHVIFGVVLFLVGAVHALRMHHNLGDATYTEIMRKTLSNLGLSKERTDHFVEHTDEYLVTNARYSQMFQSGRNALTEHLDHGTGPRVAFDEALDEWEHPKSKTETAQAVTVLFTDIAGSTAMTQKLGDAGAQDVVRIHNTIVRDAIKVFSGKEVKHTGDGIMASFASGAAGVEAAIDMQRKTKAHNAGHPELPLHLKIGLNVGEPISEDDDLFGTTVQLAARIVDKARAGQILVSSAVHGLSQGKTLKFERFGDLEMKGFDEPVTVYEAVWDESPQPQPEPVPEPVPESAPTSEPEGTATEPDEPEIAEPQTPESGAAAPAPEEESEKSAG